MKEKEDTPQLCRNSAAPLNLATLRAGGLVVLKFKKHRRAGREDGGPCDGEQAQAAGGMHSHLACYIKYTMIFQDAQFCCMGSCHAASRVANTIRAIIQPEKSVLVVNIHEPEWISLRAFPAKTFNCAGAMTELPLTAGKSRGPGHGGMEV